jgi:hypothetical protein
MLLEAAESWSSKQGVVRIVLNCRSDRDGAHRFYLANGYRQTGFRFAKVFE